MLLPVLLDPELVAAMSAAAAGMAPRGRRPPAGRGGARCHRPAAAGSRPGAGNDPRRTGEMPDGAGDAGRAGASRRARPGAFRRHRRGGHVRHRAHPAGQGGRRVRAATLPRRTCSTSSPRSARASTSATRRPISMAPTRWSCRPRSGPDNPELAEARRRGLRVLHRAAALGLGHARQARHRHRGHPRQDDHHRRCSPPSCAAPAPIPSYVIGGILAETGLGAADGRGQDFIAEADESDGSFLMLSPQAAVVTCIEADHLDNYGSLAEIEAAFLAFAARSAPAGLLVACADDPGAAARSPPRQPYLPVRVRTYGAADARGLPARRRDRPRHGHPATVTPGPRAGSASPAASACTSGYRAGTTP